MPQTQQHLVKNKKTLVAPGLGSTPKPHDSVRRWGEKSYMGQGGPRGPKGPSRGAKTLFKNHSGHRGDFEEAHWEDSGPTGGYRGYNKEGKLRSELMI